MTASPGLPFPHARIAWKGQWVRTQSHTRCTWGYTCQYGNNAHIRVQSCYSSGGFFHFLSFSFTCRYPWKISPASAARQTYQGASPPQANSPQETTAQHSVLQNKACTRDHVRWLLPSRCHPHIFSKLLFHRHMLVLKKTLTCFICQEGTETDVDHLQKARGETALVVWLYHFALYFFHGKKEGH